MASGGAGFAGLVRGAASVARLASLWRHGAAILALVLALTASAGLWIPSSPCGSGVDCLTSPADTVEPAGATVALLESVTDWAADDCFEIAADPLMPTAAGASSYRLAFRAALEQAPARRDSDRDRLPGKTGPPHV